jgi:uncharacterized LabA/DUF88 family protein
MQSSPRSQKKRVHAQATEFDLLAERPKGDIEELRAVPETPEPVGVGYRNLMAEEMARRVVILIDGANLFYAASQLDLEIDYGKLLRHLTRNRRLVRAYFYTGVDRSNEKQQGFLHWMRRNGYRVVAKDLVQFPDGSKKANVEVEIAVDMMTLASHCDTIVLLSGDGNLTYAVDLVSYRGAQIELISLRSMTSEHLINVADRYIDLESIKKEIQRC